MNAHGSKTLRRGINSLSSVLWKTLADKKNSEKEKQSPLQVVEKLIDFLENPEEAKVYLGEPPYPAEFYIMLGELYGRSLSSSGIKKKNGCFYTPISVARRLVSLVEKTGNEEVFGFDPACGTGSLLLAWVESNPKSGVVGWDIDPLSVVLTRKLLTHFMVSYQCSGEAEIIERDLFSVHSLASKETRNRKPVLLFNPPFGSKLSERGKSFSRGSKLAGREADPFALCLEWALNQNKIERGAVIVPMGAATFCNSCPVVTDLAVVTHSCLGMGLSTTGVSQFCSGASVLCLQFWVWP